MLLVISDLDLKIQVSYNKVHNKYEIEINGQSYMRLPYEAPTFDPDRANSEALFAKLSVNDRVACEGQKIWIIDDI